MWKKYDGVDAYARRRAIAGGVLIDVTEVAKDVGIRWPVAITPGVWAECVAVRPGARGVSEGGKLRDLLLAIHADIKDHQRLPLFARTWVDVRQGLERVPAVFARTGVGAEPDRREYYLHTVCHVLVVAGPGDDGLPCLTVTVWCVE